MHVFAQSTGVLLCAGLALAAGPLRPRQSADNTANVDLSSTRGSPQHLAAGFIYGIPDSGFGQNPDQVPDHWYKDVGFNYNRAGGAQIDAPGRGWIYGMSEYQVRLKSTLENYQTTRKYGGKFIILPHDVWGTDHANSSTHWPGDNGDWTDYDAFLDQLLEDLKSNDALEGMIFDIWNEPDISIFWNRTQQQWVDLYVRSHKRIRQDSSLNEMLISGPSLAFRPLPDNTWWTDWLSAIQSNNIAPDQYSYHLEGETNDVDNDLQTTNSSLSALLKQYSLPEREVNINEYANVNEQVPSGAAWWISRFERYDTIGLRGNWASGCVLHDLFASLLTKSDPFSCLATDYQPAPEYWVYKYYAQNMTGQRVATAGSGDRLLDVYSTVGEDKMVRILTGARIATGTWYITVDNLGASGFPDSGDLNIHTYGFRGVVGNEMAVQGPPEDLGVVSHSYSGGSVTFPVYQTDTATAWAFEFGS